MTATDTAPADDPPVQRRIKTIDEYVNEIAAGFRPLTADECDLIAVLFRRGAA